MISSPSSPRMTPTSSRNSPVLWKCRFNTQFLRALLKGAFSPPHLQKPRNTKFFAWELSADSWISQRCILASFHSSPQQVETRRTFTRKRLVIGFAGGTTSEINVLCTIIYLLWVCVCFCLQYRFLSLLTPRTQNAIVVTEGLSELSLERCIIWRGEALLCGFVQTGTWLQNQFAPPSHRSPF